MLLPTLLVAMVALFSVSNALTDCRTACGFFVNNNPVNVVQNTLIDTIYLNSHFTIDFDFVNPTIPSWPNINNIFDIQDATTGASLLYLSMPWTHNTAVGYQGNLLNQWGPYMENNYATTYTHFTIVVAANSVTVTASSDPEWHAVSGFGSATVTTNKLYKLFVSNPGNYATGGSVKNFYINQDAYTTPATSKPSAKPTTAPSAKPNVNPTSVPIAPTVKPTATPSAPPNFTPTAKPSANPTAAPTFSPSLSPSAGPTNAPIAPTAKPKKKKTAAPSTNPTANPTNNCVKWVVGIQLESCSQACARVSSTCAPETLATITTPSAFNEALLAANDQMTPSVSTCGGVTKFCTFGVNQFAFASLPAVMELPQWTKDESAGGERGRGRGTFMTQKACYYPTTSFDGACDAVFTDPPARRLCACNSATC